MSDDPTKRSLHRTNWVKKKLNPRSFKRSKLKKYYSFSEEELDTLSAERINGYWKAVTVIEAQDALLQLRISAYPHQKAANQKRFFDFLYKKAYPQVREKKALTVEDFMKIAKAKGLHG